MKHVPVYDASALHDVAFGPRSPGWWGNTGLIVIEAMTIALGIATYFYLRIHTTTWPPEPTPNPSLGLPAVQLVVMLVSLGPEILMHREALREGSRRRIAALLAVNVLFGIAILVLRAGEFMALHTRWDSNAYGSIVWTLLGLHTAELLGSTLESAFLMGYAARGPFTERNFSDVALDCIFWYVVVGFWLAIAIVIYLVPRL